MCNAMNKQWLVLVLCMLALNLPGCSYIQSMFPDKERDYQYTTEIPLINYPAELRQNQPEGGFSTSNSTEAASTVSANSDGVENASDTSSEAIPSDSAPSEPQPVPRPQISSTEVTLANESDQRDVISSVEVIKYDDGESRLRLGSGYSKAWRVVNKALSRNTIEVSERNHDKSQITVQYDPEEKKIQDDSFMDEINFLFRGIDVYDRPYVLKLEEHGDKTDVIVLNEEHLPMLNDEGALQLLRLLADTIKADLADKAKSANSP